MFQSNCVEDILIVVLSTSVIMDILGVQSQDSRHQTTKGQIFYGNDDY
jgi:hypothetical protein